MQVYKVKYIGDREFHDRTVLKNVWQPGDVKELIREASAELLPFNEFVLVEEVTAKPKDNPLLQAKALDVQAKRDEDDEVQESMLVTIETWDKEQLIEYAKKYETKIDTRESATNMRLDVANLIEQFGVR